MLTEEGEAAHDAEPAVEGLAGQGLAAGDRDLDDGVEEEPVVQGAGDHRARRRVDGGLAGRKRQAGPGDGADALAGAEEDAARGGCAGDAHPDQGAVGHVGVVAGVLDDRGRGGVGGQRAFGERKGGVAAARERDRDRVGKDAGVERVGSSGGGGSGAGAGGPASSEHGHGGYLRRGLMSWGLGPKAPAGPGQSPGIFPIFPPGQVWLAGAGPGDLGHLTLHAVSALEQADHLVYDALVDPGILGLARPEAVREFAGKRGGRPSPTQDDITARLVALARTGARVLRLKGGGPAARRRWGCARRGSRSG